MMLISICKFCVYNVDICLVVMMLTLIFLMKPIESNKKEIMEFEDWVIEVKGELCEALTLASKAKKAFREERNWVDALSRILVCVAIKLGKMHL